MDIKGMLADQMGHFTPYDIVGVLLSVALAALFGFLLGIIGKADGQQRYVAVLSAVIALAVALVRASVPLSIALVAVALLVGQRNEDGKGRLMRYAAAAVGLGCGSSASIVVVALLVPIGLLLRWASQNERS